MRRPRAGLAMRSRANSRNMYESSRSGSNIGSSSARRRTMDTPIRLLGIREGRLLVPPGLGRGAVRADPPADGVARRCRSGRPQLLGGRRQRSGRERCRSERCGRQRGGRAALNRGRSRPRNADRWSDQFRPSGAEGFSGVLGSDSCGSRRIICSLSGSSPVPSNPSLT
jgi:hypothetical protein